MRFPFIVLIVSTLSSILIINQVAGTKDQYEKVLERGREHRREEQAGAVNAGNSAIGWRRKRNIRGEEPARTCLFTMSPVRAIFVWRWNGHENARIKQQTNRNRAIWLVYRTDTNARGFWLVKRTLGWKNFMPENFLEINRYFALTSYCNTIGQSNNVFSL